MVCCCSDIVKWPVTALCCVQAAGVVGGRHSMSALCFVSFVCLRLSILPSVWSVSAQNHPLRRRPILVCSTHVSRSTCCCWSVQCYLCCADLVVCTCDNHTNIHVAQSYFAGYIVHYVDVKITLSFTIFFQANHSISRQQSCDHSKHGVFLQFEGSGKCKGSRPMNSEVQLEKICQHYTTYSEYFTQIFDLLCH